MADKKSKSKKKNKSDDFFGKLEVKKISEIVGSSSSEEILAMAATCYRDGMIDYGRDTYTAPNCV